MKTRFLSGQPQSIDGGVERSMIRPRIDVAGCLVFGTASKSMTRRTLR
jgi:hypothetical protein